MKITRHGEVIKRDRRGKVRDPGEATWLQDPRTEPLLHAVLPAPLGPALSLAHDFTSPQLLQPRNELTGVDHG